MSQGGCRAKFIQFKGYNIPVIWKKCLNVLIRHYHTFMWSFLQLVVSGYFWKTEIIWYLRVKKFLEILHTCTFSVLYIYIKKIQTLYSRILQVVINRNWNIKAGCLHLRLFAVRKKDVCWCTLIDTPKVYIM